ncbi:carboxylesterase [Aspergillus japonicus CBS 114.51]|uniref:Carboxylic ester hydrolase n=1 Tax=Aspergillus japonicus CBS 114.51 TaxID=1448312 RepID=A0A8T8XHT0_ASPJA|nr:carboxylesterase [Aspergillus japonicus CBS 114.51]RAH86949.1 carboxylesterase [Aspergillus japonicus CBS 114.51]
MHVISTLAGLAAVAPLAVFASPLARSSTSQLPVINTTLGDVQGQYSPFRGGDVAVVYKGIPFAAPPTGENRWKAPQPATSWSGVLNATEFGPQCAQTISSAGIFSSGKTTTSEDCLYLNIWTPNYNDTSDITSKNLPVYFWIYGGRFEGGSGDVLTYDGTGLAAKDIIVVTINYRLGAFGYLAHPELSAESGHNSSGNYGILDQQAALRWVHGNIANFGGNASQITVGGQSAGSASALDSMWSPLNKGLVAGVIAESGARGPHDPMTGSAATSYRTKAAAEAQGIEFLKELNVTSLAAARKVSTETLIGYDSLSDTIFEGTQFQNLSSFFMEPPMWRPNIDGYVLPYGYGESLSLDAHLDVPILTGNNKDESGASPDAGLTVASYKELYTELFANNASRFFKLYPGQSLAQANNNSNEFYRDLSRVGTWEWSVDWAAGGAKSPVYTYYFTRSPAENRDEGAYHGSELWYTFNNIPYSDYSNVTWYPYDYIVEERMSNYWANFIRTGNPNGDGLPEFPPSTKEKQQTMWLGNSWGSGPLSAEDARIEFVESWMATMPEW